MKDLGEGAIWALESCYGQMIMLRPDKNMDE